MLNSTQLNSTWKRRLLASVLNYLHNRLKKEEICRFDIISFHRIYFDLLQDAYNRHTHSHRTLLHAEWSTVQCGVLKRNESRPPSVFGLRSLAPPILIHSLEAEIGTGRLLCEKSKQQLMLHLHLAVLVVVDMVRWYWTTGDRLWTSFYISTCTMNSYFIWEITYEN